MQVLQAGGQVLCTWNLVVNFITNFPWPCVVQVMINNVNFKYSDIESTTTTTTSSATVKNVIAINNVFLLPGADRVLLVNKITPI